MGYSSIRKRIAFFKFLATFISVILHPLLMPTLIFATIFYFCPVAVNLSNDVKENILWMVLVTTFVFPFISTFVLFFVLKKTFSINDLYMEDSKERFYPFLFTGFFYTAITYMFIQSNLDPNMIAIMGGISLSVLIVAVITYFWKISAHAVGICGALGYILVISFFYPYEIMMIPVMVLIVLAGFLLSARLYLNSHSPSQVYIGAVFGFIFSIVSYLFFQMYGLSLIYSL